MRGRAGRLAVSAGVWAAVAMIVGCTEATPVRTAVASNEETQELKNKKQGWDRTIENNVERLVRDGREIFRHDTFGSEAFWGDTLRLHEAIAGAANGGVGPGVSPATALAVGLKVDVEALPKKVQKAIERGQVNLNDPAVTVDLLKLNAVVGVKAITDASGAVRSMGLTCAFCHSTVDDSFAPGIGQRLDGWPNRDLNVGVIVSLAPNLTPLENLLGVDRATLESVLQSWGPGRYDAMLNMDGKVFRPDGATPATVVMPAAFGLAGQNLHTYNGWGGVPYWNAYVGITQMRGKGTFYDPRLNDPQKYPLAVSQGLFDIRPPVDLVSAKLPALQMYQLSIPAPKPLPGTFDPAVAQRGEAVFNGKAQCARCHVPPLYSEPGWAMHTGAEIGIEEFQALRSPDERYRTTPLAGLFTRKKGGFYHDGRFADYAAVVAHYDSHFGLGLSQSESADLVEFLKSL